MTKQQRTRPIRDDKDLEARTAELLPLVDLNEDGKLSPEEQEYSELLGALIEQYEDAHYPIELTGAPHEYLAAGETEPRACRRRCWRASASSSALMASSSAAIFLNFRPAWTRGRSSQSAGMVSTRFLPATMKVRVPNG